MTIFILALGLAVVSFILTYLVRVLALRKNIIDVPNARSSHAKPTPRGGGLAIVFSWFIGIGILYFSDLISIQLLLALSSGLILAIIGLLDDIFTIKPIYRLVIQFVTVSLAIYFLGGFDVIYLTYEPTWINHSISVLMVFAGVWFINLYNFLDGIDGYASMEAIFISMAMLLFTKNPLCVILFGSTLGFLIWNWPKAKIFMGDVGSTQLGFILFVLGISFHNKVELNFITWLLLTSLFWFDATYTLYRRWRNKEKLSEAHRKHAYQRIVQSGLTHKHTLLLLTGVNIIIFFISVISRGNLSVQLASLAFIVVGLYAGYRLVDKRVPFK